ncbi:MAG: bifunctional [glutamate--ammonia ligase]-adenylyl-L-tyrosine phosphorylase/[glutamate--ammonia-ligase] adenylyltransferase [Desulfamplus sp.]|nr:bifunctional [glutamate--ammonia ligase]-adenylyl-L-tyrosine phosphorylase/[glutamate--ammonia-ligase] adenylyltransferase [Desulfamplus sp.]
MSITIKENLDKRIGELFDALKKSNLSLPNSINSFNSNSSCILHELKQVLMFSEFVGVTLIKEPKILVDLIESGDIERSYSEGEYRLKIDNEIKKIIDSLEEPSEFLKDDAMLKIALSRVRSREMVRVAWQDIVGRATLEETLKDLSELAEAFVDKAITFIYDKLCSIYGTPIDGLGNPQKLVVLGMGKLGAGELNFSSDIDLIFAYPEDLLFEYSSVSGREEFNTTGEFFTKMCKNFLKVFDSSIGSSTLFRVDTRLRPFGENGPIAMSFYTMEEYYQTQGRDWERYALIKARPIAGDIAAGYTLLKLLNPFIYRRYFDYGSFDSLRDMKKRITLQVRDKRFKNNIKLGAGGIREIEFFGQVFQLIRGGVEPEFQERKILKVLELLAKRNCIDEATKDELKEAYCFLRKVEHRLQEYNDRQTHDLPQKDDETLRLALSMGFSHHSFDDFGDKLDNYPDSYFDKKALSDFYVVLNGYMSKVHTHFRNLFESDDKSNQDDKPSCKDGYENDPCDRCAIIDDLKYIWQNINDPQFDATGYKVAGFEDNTNFSKILRDLAEHPNTKKLTTNGRKRLDRLIPLMVQMVSIKSVGNENFALNPETVLKRLVDLIITIERRTCYLSLLIEKPQALDNLVNLAAKSPWVISFLSLYPALLDELLAPSTLYTPPNRSDMQRDIERRMAHIPVDDFEFQLEELCIFKQVMMLRVAAADLSGNYPLMKVSDRLTEIAETVMNKVLEISWKHTVKKYGVPSIANLDKVKGKLKIDNSKATGLTSDCYALDKELKGLESPLSSTYSSSPCTQFLSPGFAAVAYGKLGGIELGYKSDLDMVFIYSGSDGYTQGGERTIENIRFYTLLGQRIISYLTLHTQAGKLYEADMRLRPSGQSGMIVSHIDAFDDYIKNEAWTWEHQAIIRARPIGGDLALQEQFNAIRKKVLCIQREPNSLKKEVHDMRERMRKEHLKCEPNMFDLKQSRGAIVDIEFLVQYLVLQYAFDNPSLTQWTDNVRLLETLANENILTPKESAQLKQGYLKLRQMVHHLNLQEREKVIPVEDFQDEAKVIVNIFEKFLLVS